MPAMEMMEGMVLAIGGALLITPGFITDTLGFMCLIPPTRRAMIHYILRRSTTSGQGFFTHTTTRHTHGRPHHRHQGDDQQHGRTIEGEFHRDD